MNISENTKEDKEVKTSLGVMENIKQWLTLLRFPNFFTLPGDIIIGYIIAEATLNRSNYLLGYNFETGSFISFSIFYLLFAIFAAYGVGLITNDLADADEDSKKRPDRPIPSGAISKKSAWYIAIFLSVVALVFAKFANNRVFFCVAGLLLLIYAYNYLLKRNPLLGPFALGICRSLAVVIGFFGCWFDPSYYPPMFYVVTLAWFLYFFGLSLVAYYETEKNPPLRGSYILLFIPLMWGVTAIFASEVLAVIFLIKEIPPGVFLGIGAFVCFAFLVLKNFIILNLRSVTPEKVQKSVGELIRTIIFLQASAVACMGYPFIALVLFLLYLPAKFASNKFYSS